MSYFYEDPETGDLYDVVFEDGIEYRNARGDRRRPSRDRGGHGGRHDRGGRGGRRDRGRDRMFPDDPMPGGERSMVLRDRTPYPGPVGPTGGHQEQYLTIRKSAIAELLPAGGKLLASMLGRPQPPRAVGDDKVDRDNAAMHRDALARHDQNQARIQAATDLAARAIKLFAN